MTIYFYTLQKNICRKIAYILEDSGNTCCVYTEKSLFYEAVANMKKAPDLLLLDYLVFNHDTFNVYRYMNEINCHIPLLFYNDPLPSPETRVQHWQMMLSLYYAETDLNLTQYTPLLNQLSHTVDSNAVRPYVSLLQPPLPCTDSPSGGTAQPDTDLPDADSPYLFNGKQRYNSLYYIYKILSARGGQPISITELHRLLKDKNIQVKPRTLYADISRLRSHLQKTVGTTIAICRTRNGYRLFRTDRC